MWELGSDGVAGPLDAKLWNVYFDAIVVEQPWVALGAQGAWEELSRAAIESARRSSLSPRLLATSVGATSARCTEFAETLRRAPLDREEVAGLLAGVGAAGVMGLRMTRWAMGRDEPAASAAAWRIPRPAAGQF